MPRRQIRVQNRVTEVPSLFHQLKIVDDDLYYLTNRDQFVVARPPFDEVFVIVLPLAKRTGQTYRIANEGDGILVIQCSGDDTLKQESSQTLDHGEDLIMTDWNIGAWA